MNGSRSNGYDTVPGCWHILGAGRIGSLAAAYLQDAGARTIVVHPEPGPTARRVLIFERGGKPARKTVDLTVKAPAECGPVARLLVTCKTPYTEVAMNRIELLDDATVIRLQNGISSLDGYIGPNQRLIEGVTTNAVTGNTHGALRVVAENRTTLGGGCCPDWFDAIAAHWPGLVWTENIRPPQWRKLVANAAINPLTAIHDVPNGALLEHTGLHADMSALIDEADALLAALDPGWPAGSHAAVAQIVRATAANTSSMRADIARGAITEIEAINGWLLARAAELHMDLPTHRRIVANVHALEPV